MTSTKQSDRLSRKTKIFYGIGDIGNAVVNSAFQFFLMKFYTDGALILPLLFKYLVTWKSYNEIRKQLVRWIPDHHRRMMLQSSPGK